MREIINLTEAILASIDLFHVTNISNFDAIKREGLNPQKSREPYFRDRYIYFSDDRNHAEAYSNHHGDWNRTITLKVASNLLDQKLLGPDDVDLPSILKDINSTVEWYDLTWKESLKLSGQCTYRDIIHPDLIMYSFDGGDIFKSISES